MTDTRLRKIAESISLLDAFQAAEYWNGDWFYRVPSKYFSELQQALKESQPITVDSKFIYLLTDAMKRLDALAESSSDEKVQYEVSYVSSQIDSFLTFTGLVEGE